MAEQAVDLLTVEASVAQEERGWRAHSTDVSLCCWRAVQQLYCEKAGRLSTVHVQAVASEPGGRACLRALRAGGRAEANQTREHYIRSSDLLWRLGHIVWRLVQSDGVLKARQGLGGRPKSPSWGRGVLWPLQVHLSSPDTCYWGELVQRACAAPRSAGNPVRTRPVVLAVTELHRSCARDMVLPLPTCSTP